ncbi:uncharacterized protein LOC113759204 [Coffea eugenioides]|uniref:uncharacterized protein LOC113759204 n=1 Tax=Coffea eugenioides TaxID=49369 RepID=UPI000F6111A7|nr:uncharacterized protein LOC113759204 [Coffea eugenioides]
MDTLEEVMRRFSLSNSEKEGVWLDEEEITKGVEECSLSLIGKVWGEKKANSTGVRSFADNMWLHPKNLKVTEIRTNLFQFSFGLKSDLDRALNGRPWIYDGQPLILLKWREGIEDDLEVFDKGRIWIQVWNLPLHWLTKEVGRKIGGIFSEVLEVIVPPGGGKEGKHMKMLVEFDLTMPLPRGTTVKFNGKGRWVEFRYEKCPDFCFCCGIIGHSEKNCGLKGSTMKREQQYGNWLRASFPRSPNRKGSSEKERNPSSNTDKDSGPCHRSHAEGTNLLLKYTDDYHGKARITTETADGTRGLRRGSEGKENILEDEVSTGKKEKEVQGSGDLGVRGSVKREITTGERAQGAGEGLDDVRGLEQNSEEGMYDRGWMDSGEGKETDQLIAVEVREVSMEITDEGEVRYGGLKANYQEVEKGKGRNYRGWKRVVQGRGRREPLREVSNGILVLESGKRKGDEVMGVKDGTSETGSNWKRNRRSVQEECFMDTSEVVESSLNGAPKIQ